MKIIGESKDVVCPLCGVAYQVEDDFARDNLTKLLRNREGEYIKELYEEAKVYVNALLPTKETEG